MSSTLALPAAAKLVELVGLRRWRNYRNLSQQALATKLDVTRQTISDWENNRTQPQYRHLQKLQKALEAPSIEVLFPPEEDEP